MKIQDQADLGQNPPPVIATKTKNFMATKSGSPRTRAQHSAARSSRYRAPDAYQSEDIRRIWLKRCRLKMQVEMSQAVDFVRAAAKQIPSEIVHGDLP